MRWWLYLGIACGISVGIAVVVLFKLPISGLFPPCPLHELTGLHCPGCGVMRLILCLLHGDFSGAFAKNQLIFFLFPAVAILLYNKRLMIHPITGWTLLGVILLYGVLRNLPWYPLVLMAPH